MDHHKAAKAAVGAATFGEQLSFRNLSALYAQNPDLAQDKTPAGDRIYPDWPGFKANGTSEEAAAAIAPAVPALQGRVLRLLQSLAPDEALTADEIAVRLQRSILSIRPRVSELSGAGKIVRTDQRGKNESGMTASKWRAT